MPSPLRRPRVLLIAPDMTGHGGIQCYSRWLASALDRNFELQVVDVQLDGSPRGQAVAFVKGVRTAFRERPDLIVIAHVGLAPIGIAARLGHSRYVVVAHGIEIWGPRSWLTGIGLHLSARVWPNSRFTAGQVTRLYPGCRTTEPLGGGLEPRQFGDPSRLRGSFRILTVSRLDGLHYKGIDTTLSVVRRLRETHSVEFRVVGDGPEEEELRRLASDPELKGSVRVLGSLTEGQLQDEYRTANVAVLASRYRAGNDPMGEGLGLTLLEAAAAGVPAIGASDGGSQDAVRDGETGFLIPAGDEQVLYERLCWLISDPSRARAMGARGRQWVATVHSTEVFGARIQALVGDALVGAL